MCSQKNLVTKKPQKLSYLGMLSPMNLAISITLLSSDVQSDNLVNTKKPQKLSYLGMLSPMNLAISMAHLGKWSPMNLVT